MAKTYQMEVLDVRHTTRSLRFTPERDRSASGKLPEPSECRYTPFTPSDFETCVAHCNPATCCWSRDKSGFPTPSSI